MNYVDTIAGKSGQKVSGKKQKKFEKVNQNIEFLKSNLDLIGPGVKQAIQSIPQPTKSYTPTQLKTPKMQKWGNLLSLKDSLNQKYLTSPEEQKTWEEKSFEERVKSQGLTNVNAGIEKRKELQKKEFLSGVIRQPINLIAEANQRDKWIKDNLSLGEMAPDWKSEVELMTKYGKAGIHDIPMSELRRLYPDLIKAKEKEYQMVGKESAFMGVVVKQLDGDLKRLYGEKKLGELETSFGRLTDPVKFVSRALEAMSLDTVKFTDLQGIGQDVYYKNGKMYYKGLEIADEYLTEAGRDADKAADMVSRFIGAVPTYALGAGLIKTGISAVSQAKNLPKIAQFFGKMDKMAKTNKLWKSVLAEATVFNVMEESSEALVRRATGQEYTFNSFINGLIWGAGLGSTVQIGGHSIKSAKLKSQLWQANKVFEKTKDLKSIKDLPLAESTFGKLFGEARYAYLDGFRKQGRPGIERPAALPKDSKVNEAVAKERLPWESDEEYKVRVGTQPVVGSQEVPKLEGKQYLERKAESIIQKYIDESLKPGMKQGVEQGSLHTDSKTGDVTGRSGRVSLNDKWYQDFYKENNKAPNTEDLRKIAVDHLLRGYEGHQFKVDPDNKFIELKAEMDSLGIEMPLKKLSTAGFKEATEKPLTTEKKLIRRMSKKRATLAELGMQDAKGERLRMLKQEVAKRLGIEKKIKTGEFEKVSAEDLMKVRKSGGIGMAAIDLIDKGAGFVTSNTVKIVGKVLGAVVGKITDLPGLKKLKGYVKKGVVQLTPQAGLADDAYKALEDYRKAQNREFKGIAETLKPLIDAGKIEGNSEKTFKYLSGEKVEVSDDLRKILDPIRDEIDIEGIRQVMIGNLPPETFYANMGKYMRRLYASHQLDTFSPLAESYNNLKNVFIKKGLSGEDAEEAIVGIMTKNLKEKYQVLLPKSIKTGGDFKKARTLGDDEMSLAIRDFLGEVQDPQFIVGRTLFDMKRSRLNYELLSELSKTSVVKDVVPAGYAKDYRKLEGNAWGMLDGKYMQKDVFEYLEEMRGQDKALGELLTKMNNFIKANLTVRNPAGQFRNLTSNFATSQAILGHNYVSPGGMKDLYDAVKSLNNKDAFYQELLAYGRIGDTGVTRDLGSRLEEVFKDTQITENNFIKIAKKVDGFLGKSYEFGDNLFLIANYKKLRAKGLQPVHAIKEASRVTPDYGEVSPLISKWRQSAIGLPFVTWRYKVYPEVIKSIISSPVRGTLPIWFPWAVGNIIAGELDLTEAEKEVFKTRLYRDGKIPLGRSENGDVIYFDYGQYTPFSDLFKGRQTPEDSMLGFVPEQLEGYAKGVVPGIGSFPFELMLNISGNYDPFTSRPITYNEAWTPEWGWDMALHVAPSLVPIIGLSANNITKVVKGEMSLPEALLKSATGMKAEVTSVGRFEKEERYSRPGFNLDKGKMDIYDRVKELASMDKEEANIELNKLYDKYPDQEKYITERVRYEKDRVEGKSQIQDKIRTEVTSLADIAKKDKDLANKRLNELYDKYPEYEEYITKKVNEIKKN